MSEGFVVLSLILCVVTWRNKKYKDFKNNNKDIDMSDLLEYLRGIEIMIIILFTGIFFMFLGIR